MAIESRLPHIAAFWDKAVAKQPNAPACIYRDRAYTFAEADQIVAQLAGYLREQVGVQPGDRVAIALPNCAAYLFAYWAALRLGAVVVPVNIRLGDEELAFVLSNCEPTVVFVSERLQERVGDALEAGNLSPQVLEINDNTDEPPCLVQAHAAPVTEAAEISPQDLAIILYTSGTTGRPKGAMMRHQDLLFNVQSAILALSLGHEDVHLLVIPYFAPTAAYSLLPACAYLASPLVVAPRAQPGELFQLIAAHRCTTFIGVPTLFNIVVNDPGLAEADLSSLRLVAYSGSPMPARTINRLRERLPHVALCNFFGLTETISITHVLPSAEAIERADSIGKALPEIYTKIVDGEDNELPADELGELCFRRDNIIPGYWRQPGRLEETIQDDWFHSGDLAWEDEEGYVYVQGRKKDMIIVAGQNVYALEVEKVILRHPAVREVAVVGIEATGARAALGELVKAVVVPQPDADLAELEVKRHCAEALPSYKVPQAVEFREELPRNAAGKVIERRLK